VSELPKGWQSKSIAEVLSLHDNGIWGPEAERSGIFILRSTNFRNDGTVSFESVACRTVKRRKAEKRRLAPGDILLERSGGGPKQPVGRVVFFNRSEGEYYFGNFVTRLRANRSIIDPRFLFHALWFLHVQGKTVTLQKQTTGIRNLNFKEYLKLCIPLPSLEEQRRIAARIEGLIRPIEEAKRLRQAAREQAEKIMPAALAEVFERAEDEGWERVAIGEVVEPTESVDPRREPGRLFKYVQISNIDNVEGRTIGHREFLGKDAPSRARKAIRTGDVLFATTRPYLRNTAIVPDDLDGEVSSTGFCVLRTRPSVNPAWLFALVRSDAVLDQVVPLMRGSSYPAVTDSDVLAATVPLPPREEQDRIVTRLDDLRVRVEQLRRLQEETQAQLDALIPAVLGKAFRGEL